MLFAISTRSASPSRLQAANVYLGHVPNAAKALQSELGPRELYAPCIRSGHLTRILGAFPSRFFFFFLVWHAFTQQGLRSFGLLVRVQNIAIRLGADVRADETRSRR